MLSCPLLSVLRFSSTRLHSTTPNPSPSRRSLNQNWGRTGNLRHIGWLGDDVGVTVSKRGIGGMSDMLPGAGASGSGGSWTPPPQLKKLLERKEAEFLSRMQKKQQEMRKNPPKDFGARGGSVGAEQFKQLQRDRIKENTPEKIKERERKYEALPPQTRLRVALKFSKFLSENRVDREYLTNPAETPIIVDPMEGYSPEGEAEIDQGPLTAFEVASSLCEPGFRSAFEDATEMSSARVENMVQVFLDENLKEKARMDPESFQGPQMQRALIDMKHTMNLMATDDLEVFQEVMGLKEPTVFEEDTTSYSLNEFDEEIKEEDEKAKKEMKDTALSLTGQEEYLDLTRQAPLSDRVTSRHPPPQPDQSADTKFDANRVNEAVDQQHAAKGPSDCFVDALDDAFTQNKTGDDQFISDPEFERRWRALPADKLDPAEVPPLLVDYHAQAAENLMLRQHFKDLGLDPEV
eukprot:TRINITY_DN6515_c0_g1_i1.p1 TRINITY_DN6515_c0_g1~~TRINITY_DN6515_c0_g1_i1.p1  ORF type:complete len:463 (-),score=86.79 TRINITY_DN6515_c0_g1_i1:77-1465(-)